MTIQEQVATLFGTPEETVAYLEKRWPHMAGRITPGTVPVLAIRYTPDSYENTGMYVGVTIPGLTTVLQFKVMRYPACCGAVLFHSFISDDTVPLEKFKALMSALLEHLWSGAYSDDGADMYLLNKRFIAVFIETGVSARMEKLLASAGHEGPHRHKQLRLMDIPQVEKPNIQYKHLWDFFQTEAARITDRPFYNTNSGNICHEIEAVFK